ncbi:MAG: polysaccharide deacetylase family protein [Candidatus Solibacter sp.]|jgi:peptidoglycan/xylan/chitin deacetylase (PgdA/CDA1 family)
MSDRRLHVVTYHYVRDVAGTRHAGIKALAVSDFYAQLDSLSGALEMATPESSMAFLAGKYRPSRDLCLLTFDDGLREHLTRVTPVLADRGIQAIFFVITSCLEEGSVAPVHMNHFLTAELGFEPYRRLFLEALRNVAPDALASARVDVPVARRTYPWDDRATACFKYLFNFALHPSVRDSVVGGLFERYLGGERQFARELYVSWSGAREMQSCGMVIGGHSHRHRPLATLTDGELAWDLNTSRDLLERRLMPQPLWPFSYPYGKLSSYTQGTVDRLRALGFDCCFSTEEGCNEPGVDLFALRRVDTRKAPAFRNASPAGVGRAN